MEVNGVMRFADFILRLQRFAFCILISGVLFMPLSAQSFEGESPEDSPRNIPAAVSFPEKGACIGAYLDFGDTEDDVSLDIIEDFEKMAGKHQAIIASSSFWGEGTFPMKNVQIISHHGAVPLIYWSPWDRPYKEDRGPDRFSLENILSGTWDSYIDAWADQAKTFGKPLLVSWGLEMNGNWFPWSGYFYGKAAASPTANGQSNIGEGPHLFREAFRYVVNRVKSRGAANILWGFHANNLAIPAEPWNSMAEYYPGADYVDWLGLSVYGKQLPGEEWTSFHEAMNAAYMEICRLDPSKPVIVAEWGVGEYPRSGDKSAWIREAFEAMKDEYRRVKAAVYWNERWKNSDDTYSNLHIHSSPEALEAYRAGITNPYWLDRLEQNAARLEANAVSLKR